MMNNMKRFYIEFSGQGYPEYRPASVTIWSQDAVTAGQWARKQLGVWGADLPTVRCEISEVKEEPPPEPAGQPQEKPRRPKRPPTKKARKMVVDQVLVPA